MEDSSASSDSRLSETDGTAVGSSVGPGVGLGDGFIVGSDAGDGANDGANVSSGKPDPAALDISGWEEMISERASQPDRNTQRQPAKTNKKNRWFLFLFFILMSSNLVFVRHRQPSENLRRISWDLVGNAFSHIGASGGIHLIGHEQGQKRQSGRSQNLYRELSQEIIQQAQSAFSISK